MASTSNGHVQLRDLTTFVTSGSRGWAQYYSESGPLFLRIGNLTRSTVQLDLSKTVHVQPPDTAEGRRTRVCPGDILVSVTADLGIIGFVDATVGEAYVNQHIALVRLDNNRVNPEWAAMFLAGEEGREQFRRLTDQGAKAGLNLDNVLSLCLPELPRDRQDLAVRVVRVMEDAIDATKAVIEQTRKLKAALLQDLLTNGLPGRHGRFKEVPFFGRIPESWRVRSLVDFAQRARGTFVNGPFGSDLLTSDFVDSGIPVLYIQDIREGTFKRVTDIYVTPEKAESLSVCSVVPSDVLITKVGDPPCVAAIYPEGQPNAIITQDVMRIRPNLKNIDPYFLVCALNSWVGRAQVRRILITGTRDRVSLGDYKSTKMLCPPLEEQQKIAGVLRTAADKVQWAESLRIQLEALKKSLSQGLLSGRIPVRGVD